MLGGPPNPGQLLAPNYQPAEVISPTPARSLYPYLCTPHPQILKATQPKMPCDPPSSRRKEGGGNYILSLVSLTSFVTYQGNNQVL